MTTRPRLADRPGPPWRLVRALPFALEGTTRFSMPARGICGIGPALSITPSVALFCMNDVPVSLTDKTSLSRNQSLITSCSRLHLSIFLHYNDTAPQVAHSTSWLQRLAMDSLVSCYQQTPITLTSTPTGTWLKEASTKLELVCSFGVSGNHESKLRLRSRWH